MSTLVREDTDPAWVDVVTGVPAHLDDGSLVWVAAADGGNRLFVGDRAVTPPTLQVRAVLDVDHDSVLFSASGDPTEIQLWTWDGHSLLPVSTRSGVFSGRMSGGVGVLTEQSLDAEGVSTTVVRRDGMAIPIPSLAERPGLDLRVSLGRSGRRDLATAVVLPSWHEQGSRKLPVLMDPYGGPHAQRVLNRRGGYLESQWFAEQGFAVIVADGRGTPGRGPAFERAVLQRPGHPAAGRPDRRPAGGGRAVPRRPRPDEGGHQGLVVRRLPGGAGRAAPARRVPRRGGGGAGDGLAAVRHVLHRAVPGASRTSSPTCTTTPRCSATRPSWSGRCC